VSKVHVHKSEQCDTLEPIKIVKDVTEYDFMV